MRRLVVGVAISVTACGRIGFAPLVTDAASTDGASPDAASLGLIAWWKLDESSGTTAADSAGGDNGTFVGTLTWEPTGGENNSGALLFPGGLTYVSVGMPANLANLPALTIAAWVNPVDSVIAGNADCILDHGAPTSGWELQVWNMAAGDIAFNVGYTNQAQYRVASPGTIPTGAWSHIAATWDGGPLATDIHLYVAGVEVTYAASSDATGETRTDDSGNLIGLGCITSIGYQGLASDIRIYDRVLSAAELAAIPPP